MNIKPKQKKHTLDMIFALSLFTVFAVTALLLVYSGTRVYENIAQQMESEFTSRTAISYIRKQMNQNNVADAIYLGEIEGSEALVIKEILPEGDFVRYIYYNEGYLCELFTKADIVPTKGAGQEMLEISGLEIEKQGNLYEFTVFDNNNSSLSIALTTL